MAIYRSGAGILRVAGAGVAGAEACCECDGCNCDAITDLAFTLVTISGFVEGNLTWTINSECDSATLEFSQQDADGNYGPWTLDDTLTGTSLTSGTRYGSYAGTDCDFPSNTKWRLVTCAGSSNECIVSSCP